jgi:hypothetical protein
MARHGFDPKVTDYTWKQNRLLKDKEALKNSVLNVIKMKNKPGKEEVNHFFPQYLNLMF